MLTERVSADEISDLELLPAGDESSTPAAADEQPIRTPTASCAAPHPRRTRDRVRPPRLAGPAPVRIPAARCATAPDRFWTAGRPDLCSGPASVRPRAAWGQ